MKIIFFGTPDYVIPVLEALHKKFNRGLDRQLIAVVTQPPQKTGREQSLTRSEVDHWGYKHKVKIIFDFDEIPDADLGIVAAYGSIIPQFVIDKFALGILNIHPSLLPKYRGASPTQAAIADGETITGVSVIKMDSQMDHGPIISSFKEEILPDDTNETLRKRLFERSAQFLVDLIPHYLNGKVKPKEQDHEQATFTKLLKKDDGFIENPFEDPAKTERLIRAMNPWPNAWTYAQLGDKKLRLKLLEAHIEDEKLILDQVQLEGKNTVTWTQFVQGYPNYKFGEK